MILTGKEILKRVNEKKIIPNIMIEPFNESQLNPNSYNLKLHNELLVYDGLLDMKKENKTEKIIIPKSGLILMPGVLYLGRTVEYTETHNLAPMLNGRSSIGRLGISIHATAGVGDIGYCGYWTLEITCVQPVVIYPYVEICQIYYHIIEGDHNDYNGKYQYSKEIQESKLYKEFK